MSKERERIEALVRNAFPRAWEAYDEGRLNFNTFGHHKEECGTFGCLVGWAAIEDGGREIGLYPSWNCGALDVRNSEGKSLLDGQWGRTLSDFFGIAQDESTLLFGGNHQHLFWEMHGHGDLLPNEDPGISNISDDLELELRERLARQIVARMREEEGLPPDMEEDDGQEAAQEVQEFLRSEATVTA